LTLGNYQIESNDKFQFINEIAVYLKPAKKTTPRTANFEVTDLPIAVDSILKDAVEFASDAKSKNIDLRLVGGIAVYLHCVEHEPKLSELYKSTGRVGQDGSFLGDIDIVAYSSQRKNIVPFFEKEKRLVPDLRFNTMFGFKRLIYRKPDAYEIDLFFDKLDYSHDIIFGNKPDQGRLGLDFPTVSLPDLLLSKLQIHKITRKDILDLALLMLFHDLSDSDSRETINAVRLGQTLASDWGFWFDANSNLQQTISAVDSLTSDLKFRVEQGEIVRSRIRKLIDIIDQTPKTNQWQKRAKTGTTKPWFRDVEEVVRT
jgi:hypothetical protein